MNLLNSSLIEGYVSNVITNDDETSFILQTVKNEEKSNFKCHSKSNKRLSLGKRCRIVGYLKVINNEVIIMAEHIEIQDAINTSIKDITFIEDYEV